MWFVHQLKACLEATEHAAAAYNSLVLGTAAVIAGIWALLAYYVTRAAESALTIDVAVEKFYLEHGKLMVLVGITLANVGKVKIQAKPQPNMPDLNGKKWAYWDGYDKIPFACTLEVRRVADVSVISVPSQLPWYNLDPMAFPRIQPAAIDVLEEYCDEAKHMTDFWLEPGESYHIGSPLLLSPGSYLAKATFVGKKTDDYWSRVFAFSVGA